MTSAAIRVRTSSLRPVLIAYSFRDNAQWPFVRRRVLQLTPSTQEQSHAVRDCSYSRSRWKPRTGGMASKRTDEKEDIKIRGKKMTDGHREPRRRDPALGSAATKINLTADYADTRG